MNLSIVFMLCGLAFGAIVIAQFIGIIPPRDNAFEDSMLCYILAEVTKER